MLDSNQKKTTAFVSVRHNIKSLNAYWNRLTLAWKDTQRWSPSSVGSSWRGWSLETTSIWDRNLPLEEEGTGADLISGLQSSLSPSRLHFFVYLSTSLSRQTRIRLPCSTAYRKKWLNGAEQENGNLFSVDFLFRMLKEKDATIRHTRVYRI